MAAEPDSGKQEDPDRNQTVYVTTDENGNTEKIIVSNHLNNRDGKDQLIDYSTLTDIENVKGDEEYTQDGDKLTWKADGSDIYYQGVSNEELPVSVTYSYKLDGKDVTADELAGKSGTVTIRVDYKNNNKVTEKVEGAKDQEVYTPFAMLTGMIFDSDSVSNIKVTNGKVVSDGSRSVVIGYGFPGLDESLKLENYEDLKDIDLPTYIEVTLDTDSFKMENSMTVATTGVFSELGLDDVKDLDDLKDKLSDLKDATDKLVDGSSDLKDGASDLSDGAGQLYDGTKDLKDGTSQLADGASQLSDGASQLSDGASQLSSGASTLKNGTASLASGASDLSSGANQVNAGAGSVNSGASQLASGAAQTNQGAGQLKDGASQLAAGASKTNDGAGQLKTGADQLAAGAS
ncbi:MAG TPA: hypothetical protein DEP00_02235, partial [Lachnospiraceae bacterium]|nr:hypothetical protein [Lachnospiraceae bacterium]